MRRDKERLTAKVNTLECEARRGDGGRALGPTPEGEAQSPRAERVVGRWEGGGGLHTRFLLAGAQAWHAQIEAAHRKMSAVATGLRVAILQAKMKVGVGTVPPNLGRVEQAHVQLVECQPPPPPPPPPASRHRRWTPTSGEGGVALPGFRRVEFCRKGGGVVLPLTS